MKFKLFALSLLLTMGGLLALIYFNRPQPTHPKLIPVGNHLFITSQLSVKSIRFLKSRGIGTIVDIRPDGEVPEQPSSALIESVSKADGLDFHYIPVPHENIPDEAVTALAVVLAHQTKPTVLYCHSGRRAVRTFALAEASRTEGPGTDAICEMVRGAGFSADDLRDNIAQRISHRSNAPTEKADGSTTPKN